jgi:MoxR-like ATPase
MAERIVTVDSVPHAVPRPFLVIATQNPIEARRHLPAPRGPARPVPHAGRRRLPRPRREVRVVLGAAAGVDPDALTPVLDLRGSVR